MNNGMTDQQPPGSRNQWDGAQYDRHHSYVWKYGLQLIDLLSPQPGECILDLGCGTGHLTAKIAESGAEVVGIDREPAMIEQARKNYPHLQFEVADATNFGFTGPFDAVLSNAVLHWIKTPDPVIACVWRALRPGGRFVAEFGGKGNLNKLIAALYRALQASGYRASSASCPWYFPSIGEYAALLEKHGLFVTYATLFDRLTVLEGGEEGLRNWMDMFADDFLAAVPPEKRIAVVRHMEQQLRSELYRDGSWLADYRRLRLVAFKPGPA